MQTKKIGDYEVEYGGEQLADSEDWAAYVAVYGPSPNPMHRNSIFPHQRVAVESVFASEAEAADAAFEAAKTMFEHK
jgi:hypothetical protein